MAITYIPINKNVPLKRGYKTLNELIKMIRQQNKELTKINCKVNITITLPIKDNERTN